MIDLRNTIAHILEHSQHLVEANEATTQQYVVLPILRALGWEDDNLASMEILPEHSVEKGYVDYALKVERKLVLFVECKRWSEPLEGHESQITNYAFNAGAPIAVLTNGKIWHFYFSWVEGTSVSERIFCEIDIEDQENTISDLKKYLLKFNVVSGEAERNAKVALKEKRTRDTSEPSPIVPSPTAKGETTVVPSEFGRGWTIARVKDSLSPEVRDDHEKNYPEERRNLFYKGAAEVQNLIEKKGWGLDMKLSKVPCSFFLKDKGVTRIRRVFGLILAVHLPHGSSVDREGKVIGSSLKSTPPRLFVRIMEEEAMQLEREHDGCEFCAVSKDKPVDFIYYYIRENILDLLPVLEFAYNKHSAE
jgi:hypothetical protein